MGQGNKRLRGRSWQLRAYAGTDPVTGQEIVLTMTVPPRNGRPVDPEEAETVLAELAARAERMRDAQASTRTAIRLDRKVAWAVHRADRWSR